MQITVKRRSRMRRQSTGKRIALTDRDIEIFRLLARYRYLRSTFIHAFVGGDRTKLIERLGHLYHDGGYINRPPQQWHMPNARYQPAIYELDAPGERQLYAAGIEKTGATWLCRSRSGIQHQFSHALMICDVLASIELGARANRDLRFITWNEILAHPRCPEGARESRRPFAFALDAQRVLIPDAIFGLEYSYEGRKAYRFCALEADRGTMPVSRADQRQSSFQKKLFGYNEILFREWYRKQFGIPNLFVLTVTAGAGRIATIMQALAKEAIEPRVYLFKAWPSAPCGAPSPSPGMLTESWLRVGHASLLLDQP